MTRPQKSWTYVIWLMLDSCIDWVKGQLLVPLTDAEKSETKLDFKKHFGQTHFPPTDLLCYDMLLQDTKGTGLHHSYESVCFPLDIGSGPFTTPSPPC